MQFSLPQCDDKRCTRHVFISPTTCEQLTGQPINYATSRFQYLSGLDLADSSNGKDCLEVGVPIRVDQYWMIVTGRS